VRRKLIVDLEYIELAGCWLDVRILFCTLLRMAWIKGPVVTRLLGLERVVVLAVASPTKPSSAAVSIETLAMNREETVADFVPATSIRPTGHRHDCESSQQLSVAAVQDA
jgi:hypothetical protein